ncbi:transcriptional adapter 2-alpha [Caerostris extrusa]|uniref:Transcriptional adapter n=1 Tax=Caerostris extrusa TaxID=172846 RepID=A0AAV4QTH4_CAEEX|nr:transcriptional adapter 2-alpha [Caerostris extrusa]
MEELTSCPICGILLQEPYIFCVECNHSFCLQCFAKGREYENHRNNHPYTVMRNNFSLFDSEWMASEEIKLLNAIADHGIGNWSEIAKDVGTKNKTECEEHYLQYYIYNPVPPLPEIKLEERNNEVCHPTPVSCTTFSYDPPRPIVGSILYQEMAGYMPSRGDFASEHDDFAELDIKELSFQDDDTLWNELQLTVLNIYQSRLKERYRRKCLIKDYGLLNIKHNFDDFKRYASLGSDFLETMKPLMHLFKPDKFFKLLEGLLYEHKLKNRIRLLQECRANGITKLKSIPTYLRLKKRREEQRKRGKSALDDVLSRIKDEGSCHNVIRKQVLKDGPDNCQGRRPAPPLNIAAMPGFEKLSNKERELCSSLRLVPASFLHYKAILVHEYQKLGSLRLANARSVIKIDVNKTRKIYDLLLQEGIISKG